MELIYGTHYFGLSATCSFTNSIIRKGFLYDFMKTVLFKPLLTMIGRQKVKKWFQNQDTVPLPDEKEVFKSGTSFVNYIHLQVSLLRAQSAWDIPYLNRKIFLFRFQIFKPYFFCH